MGKKIKKDDLLFQLFLKEINMTLDELIEKLSRLERK
tara:strand:- start:369 stop:479 length:111 start_codon:yes stop_codon:yes gene_type:complete